MLTVYPTAFGRRAWIAGLPAVAILTLALLLLSAATAKADETGCPGGDPTSRPVSNLVEASKTFSEEGKKVEYTFTSVDAGGIAGKGVPGLIEYCVYYPEGADPAVNVNAVPGGAQGFDGSFFQDPPKFEAFGFQRSGGNETNIPFDGTTRVMGWGTWAAGAPTNQVLVLHINDEAECDRLGLNSETCFVQPGTIEEQPPADGLTATKTATPSLQRRYEWEIEKEVDKTKAEISGGTAIFNYTVTVTQAGHSDGGWKVNGEIEVNNPNSGAVGGVEVEDAISKGAGKADENSSCEVEGGSGGAEIEAESSRSFAYTCEYSGAPESEEETNVARITWPEQTVDGRLLDEGETEAEAEVNWSEAEVEGLDESVTVEDSRHGPLGTVGLEESPRSFEYEEEFEGVAGTCTEYDNEAHFVASDSETEGSAEAGVEVCVGQDLEVSKTAEPSFERKYPWSIKKSADKEEVRTTQKNASFNYTIKVVKGGGEDSGWIVKGKIKVANPNDWEPITVNVADEIEGDSGAECSVAGGEEAEIPAGESEEFEYECIYEEAPASSAETNVATATWDGEAAHTPSGEASGTAKVDWAGTEPKTTDACVTEVTDTVDGTSTKLEGLLCESKTFEETITFPVKSGCVDHVNVAKTTTQDTEQTLESEVKVRVCGVLETGALTMGYWQNKNGQAIITGGHETSKVCDSATWLRKFPPFQDLSSSANCQKVAEYVTSVIKSANAGGAAMNAMLKGQMLATALDVYFSDPALGGNKIKAPSPIGGQKIDLTKVCKNIPACTTFENTSAAFGGAKSMTVLELLTYAGGKSNAGGSSWYGQVKATQELAKDTFDAINNQVAFGP